jgi:glycosyltransferase involved in cell wall biosynthesis
MSGLELFGLRFANDLRTHGNPVVVACPHGGPIHSRAREMSLPTSDLAPFSKWSPVGIFRLIRLFRSLRPHSIVAFRTGNAYPVHLGKLITRLHAPLFLFYRIGAGNHSRRDPIHRRLFQQIAGVVPNAEHVENKIRKFWAISPEKIQCIRSGVDTEVYRPDPERRRIFREMAGIPPDALVFGNTGRIHPEKGSRILLETLFSRGCFDSTPREVHLVYIGREYVPGYSAELKEVARNLGVADRFHILPFRSDIQEAYPGFDFFALAVTSHETYAYVTLEAMASGVVPVVPLVGGMKEMFTHGCEGFFFTHRNTQSLREALMVCLNLSEQKTREMGILSRKRIEQTASWENMMLKYVRLFGNSGISLKR